jgi:hypothetical protein
MISRDFAHQATTLNIFRERLIVFTVTDCKSVYLALAVQREHPLTRLSEDECSCSGGVRFASHPLADVRVAQRTSHDPYTV